MAEVRKNRISDTLSSQSTMTGEPSLDYNKMPIEFGGYAQVFEDNNPTNATKARTPGAIVLNPTGNEEGGYFYVSLETGLRLSRQQWNEIPMPEGVIDTVEAMALAKQQPPMENGVSFEWAPGIPIDNNNTEVNLHRPDEATQNNVEVEQNNILVGIKQKEESDNDEDSNDEGDNMEEQPEKGTVLTSQVTRTQTILTMKIMPLSLSMCSLTKTNRKHTQVQLRFFLVANTMKNKGASTTMTL